MKKFFKLAIGALACLSLVSCTKVVTYDEFHAKAEEAVNAGWDYTKAAVTIKGTRSTEDGTSKTDEKFTATYGALATVLGRDVAKAWICDDLVVGALLNATAATVQESQDTVYKVGNGFEVSYETNDSTSKAVYNKNGLLTSYKIKDKENDYTLTAKYSK